MTAGVSVDVHGEEIITEVSSKCGIVANGKDLVEDVKIHDSPVNGHAKDVITSAASTHQDLPNGKDLVDDVKIHDSQVNGDGKDITNLDLEGEKERSIDVAVDGYHDNGKMEEGEKVEVECEPDDEVDVQNGKEESVGTDSAEFNSETVAQEEPRVDEVVCGGTNSDENGADLLLLPDDQAQGTISDLVAQVDGDKIASEQNGSSDHRESMPSSTTVYENGVVECAKESSSTWISLDENLSGPMEVESELSVETAVAHVQLEKQVSEDLASDENRERLPTGNTRDKLPVSDLVVDNEKPEQNGHPDVTEAGEDVENLPMYHVVDAMVVPEIENSSAIVQEVENSSAIVQEVENSAEAGEGAENMPTDPVVDAMVVPEVENSSAIAQDIPASADGGQSESEAVKSDLESCETAVSHPDDLTSAESANEESASEVVKSGFETCETTFSHPVDCTDVEPANVESEVNCGLGDKEATTDGDITTESKVSKAQSIPVDDAGEESCKIDSVENENSLGADVKLEPETDNAPALSNGDMAADETIVAEPQDVNGPDECTSDSDLNIVHVENGEERPEVDNGHVEGSRDTTLGDSSEGEPVVMNGSVIGSENTPISIPDLAPAAENGRIRFTSEDTDISTGQDTVSDIASHKEEASVASSQEDSITDALVKQNMVAEVGRRPFNFMIKVPRYDDENLKEQIKHAQLLVEKKTEIRDSVRVEIQKQRGTCQECGDKFEDAISEEKAARGLLKSKRKEIDSVQSVINIVKDAMSVEDIDLRLRNLEHMISHETMSLKKEKEMIREMKQIKQLREQLSSNIGKPDEVQQALDQKGEVHERFKVLRKEEDALRINVMKAEVVTQAAKKKYYDESDNLSEWQAKVRTADDIRQEAYLHLQSLRKQLNEKNKYFWQYKDDVKEANDLILKGDKDGIQHLCVNQVERFMKMWNENDEFRKEYTRCNSRSTLRRLRTLDGRSLGPDEVPPFIPSVINPRNAKYRTMTPISTAGGEKQEEVVAVVTPVEADKKENKDKIGEQKIQTAKSNKAAKPVSSPEASAIANGLATVSGQEEKRKDEEEAQKAIKEEEELAQKAEEIRKEEEAAMLKEKRRLEEKVKAKEALERKKRNAEKAQARAAIRAQKEAEQKEKERERRLKKKEKTKAGATTEKTNEEESTLISESIVETPKEFETKEKLNPAMTKKFAKQQSKVKSIPPPLRNRGKRRMQAWMWVLLAAVLVFGVFLLGNNYPSLKFENSFN